MKKNKLINGTKLLIVTALLFFNSCSNEEYDGELNSSQNLITNGIEITEDIAKEVALNFYNITYKSRGDLLKSKNKTLRVTSTETIKDFNNQTGIYIVNIEPNGYVLVTSNSKNVPIAAHSETGIFELNENSPSALKMWIAENIAFNDILESREAIEEIDKQWYYLAEGRFPYPGDHDGENESPNHTVRYSHTVNEQFGPLLTTLWSQGNPYNNFTNGNPTGCVAVAMAQIMRYHEYPNTFNWSIMPNEAFWNSAGALEIASLMHDIGLPQNVDMDYSPSSSSASSSDARNVFVNSYGYSNTADYDSYNLSRVAQEIKMYNRPVYIRGCHTIDVDDYWLFTITDYDDCHAWVCDGYKQQYDVYIHNEGTQYEYTQQENRYEWLHHNWGWGQNRGNAWYYKNQLLNNDVLIEVDGNNVNPNFGYDRKCIY